MKVVALVATIPARRALCERLLAELAKQTRPPDALLLRLDGYGSAPAPVHSFSTVWESRSTSAAGPGARWLAALDAGLNPDDIIVCIDDDAMLVEAPRFVERLVAAIEITDACGQDNAAAAMGTGVDGKVAQPGAHSRGQLIYAAGLGLTVRARHLVGLREFSAEVQAAGGPDMLGLLGDDDALVSAHLWKTGVPIVHAATGNVFQAPGSKATSHSLKRIAKGERPFEQKLQLQRVTGWPFRQRSKVFVRARV